MSISQRLYLILGIMVLLISVELTALWFTIHTLSAVRSYVGGEGLWSKAEKDATYQLEAYGRTRDPKDYQAYLALLRVSMGDRQARLEMAKPHPDWNREFQGFTQGGNDPDDIPGMIALFERFSHVSYISDAIADWTQGDALMQQLQGLATTLHAQVEEHGAAATVNRTLNEIGDVNKRLTVVEDRFSYTLGQGSRWLTGLVLAVLAGAALTVELSGVLLTASVTGGLSRRLKVMLAATDQISKGDYGVALDTTSTDELGRLSTAFNDMAHDIERERVRAERAVVLTEAALKEAQRVAHVGSWEWDIPNDRISWSKEFLRLCEVSPASFYPCYAGFIRLVHPHDQAAVDEVMKNAVATRRPFTVDYRIARTAPALERWICTQGTVECDKTGAPIRLLGTTLDITERKRSEERLTHLAQHDPLTGLPNRALLMDSLRHAVAVSQRQRVPGALLFLDLDHFKNLNDTLGHAAGDRLLRSVGERLKGRVRGVDTVARSGGDEFLIVLSSLASADSAKAVAQHVMGAFAQPFSVDGHELFATASMGISVFPNDGVDVEILIRDADTAMYQAKRSGRNKFQFFSAHMHEQAVKAMAMQNELRGALERGEFVVHYQPLIELAIGSIVGAEALLRWQRPSGALRLPDEFIKEAEDNGLIVPIGDWVLREACAQSRRWKDAGFDELRMTVNVSKLQLNQPDFTATVAAAIRAAGLEANDLELEITETAVMVEADRAERILAELQSIGVRVLLDDFGTGYSSLNYLKRFAIDAVKIDRSFVKDIVSDSFDQAIAKSIVDLCHTVGLRITAEGVETRAQFELLRTLGCDEVQGFCFSAAVKPEKFEEMLRCWGGSTIVRSELDQARSMARR